MPQVTVTGQIGHETGGHSLPPSRWRALLYPSASASGQHHSLLLFRFVLLNLLASALLAAAWRQGYVDMVLQADSTRLSVAIFIVFAVGLFICAQRCWQLNTEIDSLDHAPDQVLPQQAGGGTRLRLAQRIALIRHLANTLVLMGLIGTVLGFIIALSGVDPEQSADISAIGPMVSTLIQGMSTALYTTLVGSILNVWLMANYQLLTGGTVALMAALEDRQDSAAVEH